MKINKQQSTPRISIEFNLENKEDVHDIDKKSLITIRNTSYIFDRDLFKKVIIQ